MPIDKNANTILPKTKYMENGIDGAKRRSPSGLQSISVADICRGKTTPGAITLSSSLLPLSKILNTPNVSSNVALLPKVEENTTQELSEEIQSSFGIPNPASSSLPGFLGTSLKAGKVET